MFGETNIYFDVDIYIDAPEEESAGCGCCSCPIRSRYRKLRFSSASCGEGGKEALVRIKAKDSTIEVSIFSVCEGFRLIESRNFSWESAEGARLSAALCEIQEGFAKIWTEAMSCLE